VTMPRIDAIDSEHLSLRLRHHDEPAINRDQAAHTVPIWRRKF
jgi:hypothetical protein